MLFQGCLSTNTRLDTTAFHPPLRSVVFAYCVEWTFSLNWQITCEIVSYKQLHFAVNLNSVHSALSSCLANHWKDQFLTNSVYRPEVRFGKQHVTCHHEKLFPTCSSLSFSSIFSCHWRITVFGWRIKKKLQWKLTVNSSVLKSLEVALIYTCLFSSAWARNSSSFLASLLKDMQTKLTTGKDRKNLFLKTSWMKEELMFPLYFREYFNVS